MLPVGLVSYRKIDGNSAKIDLDFAIPDYRDLKNTFFSRHVIPDSSRRKVFTNYWQKEQQKYIMDIWRKLVLPEVRTINFMKKVCALSELK